MSLSWTFPMLGKNSFLIENLNHGFACWIYGIVPLLALLRIWKFVPETKGKTLEEMEKIWKQTLSVQLHSYPKEPSGLLS